MKKESLSIVTVKTLLAVIIFAGMGVIIIGGGYIVGEYGKNKAENKIAEPVDQEIYYQELSEGCEKFKKSKFITDYDCCLQSVEIMRKGNFKLAPESICSDGFQINSLWCGGAYSWCEPIKENCAKSGEFANPDNLKGKTNYPDICCEGLKGVNAYKVNKDGECEAVTGTPYLTCVPCGNGVCDEISLWFENKCNCPEDCGEIKISDRAIYKSERLGIMFRSSVWLKNLPEENFKNTIIEENSTIKSTATQGSSITVFEKSKNETIEEAIEKIIKKEGGNLEDCKIIANKQDTLKDSNDILSISLKENYEPSDDEIMAKIGNIDSLEDLDVICKTTPECKWAKQILIEEKTKTKCSQYAKCFGYKCGSNFIYQPNNSEEKFIYLQSMAITPSFWEWNSIEILKDQSNNAPDWQTYRNEEFGFEVKYLRDWKTNEAEIVYGQNKGYEINFLESEKFYGIGIKIFKMNQGETDKEFFDKINKVDLINITKDKKTIAGIEAEYYKNIPSHSSYDEAFFVYDSYFYGIARYAIEEDIFDQILSTFKFIEK